MRDRLTKLLQLNPHFDVLWFGGWEEIADYLLENGVIVAPMPMADWLRKELTEYVHKRCVEEL